MDVARLGLAVDSSQVEKGTVSLHQLTGAAGQASAAARQLAGASQVEAVGQKAATAATIAHTAALQANAAAMRMGTQVRTNMIYQLNDIGVSLASGMSPLIVAVQQIPQMLQFGLKPALDSLMGVGKSLVTTFWPVAVAVGAVSAAVAGLTYEINKTAEVQVGFFDVVQAGWELTAEKVGHALAPVWEAMVAGAQWVWDTIAPGLKWLGNALIAPWALGVKAIGTLWGGLPAAMGDVMITAANVIVKGVEWSINTAAELLDGFIMKANEGLAMLPGGLSIPTTGRVQFGGASNPYAGALGRLGTQLNDDSVSANSTDYMGNMFGAISGRAQEIARTRQEMDALGGSTKAANDNAKDLATDGLAKVGEFGKSVLSTLISGFADMFKGLLKGTTSVTDALSQLLGKLGDLFIDQAFNMLLGGLSGGSGGGGLFGWLGGLFGFANGGVFSGGHVQAFARGGIVNSPTLFPMANGAGLMGEAGPEAIMPLRRGADGHLGVAANSNGGSMHVSVGVTVDDEGKLQAYVKSISRQEAQSAAAVGTQVAVAQANKTAPASVANYQKQRAGSDYRTM